jgi:hypothetical protein
MSLRSVTRKECRLPLPEPRRAHAKLRPETDAMNSAVTVGRSRGHQAPLAVTASKPLIDTVSIRNEAKSNNFNATSISNRHKTPPESPNLATPNPKSAPSLCRFAVCLMQLRRPDLGLARHSKPPRGIFRPASATPGGLSATIWGGQTSAAQRNITCLRRVGHRTLAKYSSATLCQFVSPRSGATHYSIGLLATRRPASANPKT